MNTKQYYYLVTIAGSGNLSKAAKILGISQPALSKFLGEYESGIGFPLFLRYRAKLTPTVIGKFVIGCAEQILKEQTRMMQTMRTVSGDENSRIRLSTAPNRGAILYSQIYKDFSRRYPDISLSLIELFAKEQPGAILHGQVDLAIGSGSFSNQTADIPIAKEELLISLPVSHPLAKADKIRLAELCDTPFVLQSHRHNIRLIADELFREAGFLPVIAFESDDVILVDSMLHEAVGAGLVSQAHVFPCPELVYLPLDPPVYQTLHIRYPLSHKLTEPERYLAGLLARERLSDSRYIRIDSPELNSLLDSLKENKTLSDTAGKHSQLLLPDTRNEAQAPAVNLNTQLLQYITAIVDEKSLTQAAEKYNLTQPSLSRHLRNAEAMLCTSLFTRVHNRLQPTKTGTIFVNSARNILKLEEDIDHYAASYRQGHGGSIFLKLCPELLPYVKEQLSLSFSKLHPDMQLCIEESSREETQEALMNASADLGLYLSCEREDAVLHQECLDMDELIYISGNHMPLPCGQELLLNHTLPSRPFMTTFRKEGSLREEQGRLALELFSEPPEIICEAKLDVLRRLVYDHVGDTILPEAFVPDKMLHCCHSFSPKKQLYLLLASHPARNLPSAAKDLAGLLREELKDYFASAYPKVSASSPPANQHRA